MTDFAALQGQLASALQAGFDDGSVAGSVSADPLASLLCVLIDALPVFGDAGFVAAHRGLLTNLLAASLPNDAIVPEPDSEVCSYAYTGHYTGYRDAFFNGWALSAAGSALAAAAASASSSLAATFWNQYAVAVLTDAVQQVVPAIHLDTDALTGALTTLDGNFMPALSASYQIACASSYPPTAAALSALAGQAAAAAQLLAAATVQGAFTANVNSVLGAGGENAAAATWFLFNLWIALRSLGADVDSVIENARSAGLEVPAELGPGAWWNGSYRSWYQPLGGADVSSQVRAVAQEAMPEWMTVAVRMPGEPSLPGQAQPTFAANGYAQSLCCWGALAVFQPHHAH